LLKAAGVKLIREAKTDMANHPKKTIDPTEAALSAIQEALNIHDEDDGGAAPSERMTDYLPHPEPRRPVSEPRRPASAAPRPAFRQRYDSDPIGSSDLDEPTLPAANDDQQSMGRILYALRRHPARASYGVAGAASAAWVIGCLALSWVYLSEVNAALGPGHSSAFLIIGLCALVLLPVIFFFGAAHLAWRSQELRLIAQSMANVAMRLAEPETVARDSVVSIGQAVRREVAAMGDGIERALARAGELETVVQNEVALLARSYSENETRILGLIQDLASQRDRLVSQAEQVRSAVNNVHIDLTQDLTTISDLVGQQVNDAAQRITNSLAEKGEHITFSLDEIGDNMIDQLSVRGGELLKRLEITSAETARAIATATDRLTSSLGFKTENISEEFAEIAQGLEDMMNARLDRVTEGFSEKSLAVVDMMVGRSEELSNAIIETSSRIAETIATSAEEVNSTLKTSSESLVLDLNLRGGEVAAKLEEAGTRITDSLISRSNKMTDSVRVSAEQLVEVITSRSDAVKELLATRLAAYEDMFTHSGVELGERISRDAETLGNLITRHLSEFDRTVKTYGTELVERLGSRTQEISESMRNYIDGFDDRITSRASDVTAAVEQRMSQFQDMFDNRTHTITESLSTRVAGIAKTLTEGGKDLVGIIDQRVADIAGVIDSGGQKISESAGRAEAVIREMETHSRAAADMLETRLAHTSETLGKSMTAASAATDALNRSAADATASLNRSATILSSTISKSAAVAGDAIDKTTASSSEALGKSTASLTEAISRMTATASETLGKSAVSASEVIGKSASAATDAISTTAGSATDLITQTARATTDAIGHSASEAERTLVGISADVARNISGRADDIHTAVSQRVVEMTRALEEKSEQLTRAIDERSGAMTRSIEEKSSDLTRVIDERSGAMARSIEDKSSDLTRAIDEGSGHMSRTIDEKSNALLAALSGKGEQFAGDMGRSTDEAVKAIEAKGFIYTQTMMANSEEIARLINEASENATSAVTRTLGQLQEGTQGVVDAAKSGITRTLQDLHTATRAAVEESKQTASTTVAEMMETHGMLRTDSTALFERLREANILLQEVLSGAHENMNAIEHTMVSRVSDFVTAMNELNTKNGAATAKVEEHLGAFNNTTIKVLHDLGELAVQFNTHGRSLAEAVELLDKSNRRTEESVSARQTGIEALVAALDTRTNDFEQRLRRFSSLLDESLDSATTRAREIASIVAETSNESVHTIEQQFDLVRTSAEEQRKRTSETLTAIYRESTGELGSMFDQSSQRFTEIMFGMKQMATEMQHELEATRAELRRGVFELPKETSESTAQMRRVIVDQIEALAELNRIVARHGRALDAVEPISTRREAETAYAAGSGGGGRMQARPVRVDLGGAPSRPVRDITGAPTRRSEPPVLSPVPGGKESDNGRSGWLSDLLTRASRDEAPSTNPSREGVGSLESLSVDIARMVDHDATADLWERYQRGERGIASRHLYTPQGQKAFEEIQAKYRSDAEFRQTVEHYIHEFERLLEDVSRGERGSAVARNYLTSDTGKVYTMLAHAAGRLDQ
jgi:Apolipoprotein A1/A4/E domain